MHYMIVTYLPHPGTAEEIAQRTFIDLTGRPTTPLSAAYWAARLRENFWGYKQLMEYMVRTSLPKAGTAEQIVQNVFFDISGHATTPLSERYWAARLRENGWGYRQLFDYFENS